ncbi:pyruvate formate-lyase-activating protein [Sansalvadorimonas sp. 2012CJ34-2]|uniref:Pyruvate formate-lyase-activating enzyme n=1 Tax=Parendozoicomonas callyspongiae TaxID=2942213 RepID=A0ABT0PKG4_9GAMM|nr:pyruvate formate-lyase-activating protein [Sansalvadorimonas sp. 2012CJ34-2]MCL6271870.1 pyruvate formate-lyase-activating protein [Sansalvadorimonas sp. 2012CJ34-2]
MLGRIHSTDSFGTVDGPGIRFVVFTQGCVMRCRYCHNRDTWSLKEGEMVTVDELMKKILAVKHFLTGGVTVSGGQPTLQPEFVAELFKACRAEGIHTCLDTNGYVKSITPPIADLVDNTDLVLLDIKHMDNDLHEKLTWVKNDRVLSFARYLDEINKPTWVRYVVVEGYTTKEEYAVQLADFIEPMKNIEKVELLPYHSLGKHKWDMLKDEYELDEVKPPSDELMQCLKAIFTERGMTAIY